MPDRQLTIEHEAAIYGDKIVKRATHHIGFAQFKVEQGSRSKRQIAVDLQMTDAIARRDRAGHAGIAKNRAIAREQSTGRRRYRFRAHRACRVAQVEFAPGQRQRRTNQSGVQRRRGSRIRGPRHQITAVRASGRVQHNFFELGKLPFGQSASRPGCCIDPQHIDAFAT